MLRIRKRARASSRCARERLGSGLWKWLANWGRGMNSSSLSVSPEYPVKCFKYIDFFFCYIHGRSARSRTLSFAEFRIPEVRFPPNSENELWIPYWSGNETHGNEYLNFDFRRVPKINSEFPILPEKPRARQLVPNTWGSSSEEFWKWTLSSLLVRKKTHRNEHLNFDFRRVPKMNSEFPIVPEKIRRKSRAPQLMHMV